MKKITLIAAVALSATILASCGSSKKVVQQQPIQQPQVQQESDTQRKIRETQEQIALAKAQAELEIVQAQLNQAISNVNLQPSLENGAIKLLIPCMQEALALESENQWGAQGMATGKTYQEDALIDANRVAGSEFMSRFLGVIKNGIEQYSKDTHTKSLTREQKAQLEGLCVAAGEKAINELMRPRCREYLHEKQGTFGCYVALSLPCGKVLEKVNNAVEVAEIDIDKAIFRQRMQAELDAESAKQQLEKQAELERIKALKE